MGAPHSQCERAGTHAHIAHRRSGRSAAGAAGAHGRHALSGIDTRSERGVDVSGNAGHRLHPAIESRNRHPKTLGTKTLELRSQNLPWAVTRPTTTGDR